MHDEQRRRVVVEGLAAYADAFVAMGDSQSVVRAKLIDEWRRHGSPLGAFADAARAITLFPQPEFEDAETTERNRPIREMLGVTEASEQLAVTLRAREMLEDLAAEFG